MKRVGWLIVIIIYCMGIFIFTHSPVSTGEHTLSMWESVFALDGRTLEIVNLLSRKLTHLATFGFLGWLFYRLFGRKHYFYAWVAASIYGCLDEWHQTFIDGRMGTVIDAGINSFGAFLVLVSLYVFNKNKISE